MKNHHKFFRNQRYKQRLETQYNNGYNKGYPGTIEFLITDKNALEELITYREYVTNSFQSFWIIETSIGYWDRGASRITSNKRPACKYSIVKRDIGWSNAHTFLKKKANRRLRKDLTSYKGNQYRKRTEVQWELD